MSFPSSPLNNQTVTVNNITYIYSSASNAWTRTQSNAPIIISGNLVAANVIASTSSTTGALVVPNGGAGIGGNIYAGGDIYTSGNVYATNTLYANGAPVTTTSTVLMYQFAF